MGLGLTISKLILNELGGEIRLDSEKDLLKRHTFYTITSEK